jgi:hypothetical protein
MRSIFMFGFNAASFAGAVKRVNTNPAIEDTGTVLSPSPFVEA